jgi:hypothetical protein
VNIETIPSEATITTDKITKEMIIGYQKNKDRGYIDPLRNTNFSMFKQG